MSSRLLEAHGVARAFGSVSALDGVDVALAPNELVAVVGPNGSGKTTLLRVLSGVLAPSRGEVALAGLRLDSLARREIARRLAVVPQDTPAPFPFCVREIVALGRAPWLSAFGRAGIRDAELVDRALAAFELESLAERAYPTLSGGERQRVQLARACAQAVDLWLLDEPTAQMDLRHRLRCFEWLRAWLDEKRGQRAALVVTHDLSLAARFADRVLLLERGRLVATGEPEAVLTPETIARVYGTEVAILRDPDGRLVLAPRRSLVSASQRPGL